MAFTRRMFFSVAGGALVASGGALAAFSATREPQTAVAPWSRAGAQNYADPRIRAASHAILAPNPHNRQPWLMELVRDDTLLVTCDLARRLPETDPFDRQITIGFGCFLELLSRAAAADGWRADIALFPEGEPEPRLDARPVARVTFSPGGRVDDPLYAVHGARRSNKDPFDMTRPVTQAMLDSLVATAPQLAGATLDPAEVAGLRGLTWQAYSTEMRTHRTLKESIDLLRIGRAEIEANPDGIDISGTVPELMAKVGLFTREQALDPASTAFSQAEAMGRAALESGMAYFWLKSPANTRADQIAAGRAWLVANLEATRLGLGFHPVSQALQEYSEMRAHFDEVHLRLGARPGERIQMLGRVGFGTAPAPSPRWPVETRIKT